MFRTLTNLAVAAAIFTLSTTAAAQSLDGQVVRNPDDTVTYTIDIDGPPRGACVLLMSPFLSTFPIQIPGFYHTLWLDPLTMVSLGEVPLDPVTGHGCAQFTVPAASTFGSHLYFQTINLDEIGQFALSQNVLMCMQHIAPPSQPESFAMAWSNGVADCQVWGDPGDRYTVIVKDDRGNVVAQRDVQVGANGTTGVQNFPLPGLGDGWTYEVWKDIGHGHVTQRWSGSF